MKNSFLIVILLLTCGLVQAQRPLTNGCGQYLRLQSDSTYVLREYEKVDSVTRGYKKALTAKPYIYNNAVDAKIDRSHLVRDTIVYKNTNGRELKIFIERPITATSPTPIMVFIHGGAWQGGSPDRYLEESAILASNGICSARITYTLIPQGGTFDSVIEDINDAMKYLTDNAAKFNIDPSRVGFCGDSAGAHLAGVMAMTTPECKVFIGISGAYDLTQTNPGNFPKDELKQRFFGNLSTETIRRGSPMHLIPDNPPASLLFHGTADLVIDYRQSEKMSRELRLHKAKVSLNIHKGYAHTYAARGYSDMYDKVVDKICRFSIENL